MGEWEDADEARAVVHAEEAQPEEAQAAHEAEGGGGRPLTETPLDRCLGAGQTPPFTLPDELPDGWVCRVHEKSAENTTQYKRYEGPNGERAQSRRQVWVLHAESTGSVLLAGVAETGPSAKRRCKDRPPPGPLLTDDQVRKLAEAKELKDKELIDEDEYKQMKAVILGKTIVS